MSDDIVDFEVVEDEEERPKRKNDPRRNWTFMSGWIIDDPMAEWRSMDRREAVHDAQRFVERAKNGDCSSLPNRPPEPEWDLDVPDEPEPSTPPAIRLIERRSVVTTSVNWQGDNTVPPHSNSEVQAVMNELKIGRRRAYEIVRERKAKQIDTNGVGSGQRVQVMSVLISHPDAGRNSEMLMDALHREGVRIDIHDVNKTLWSLLKMGYVRLRSKDNFVYAIKVTPEGLEMYDSLSHVAFEPEEVTIEVTSVGPAQQDEAAVLVQEHVQKVVRNARALQREINDLGAGKKPDLLMAVMAAPITEAVSEDTFKRPWIKGNLGGWPSFRDVLERATKAVKINAAAKLLEEAGEEDIALTLMGRTEFTALEEEVVHLLRIMGEID